MFKNLISSLILVIGLFVNQSNASVAVLAGGGLPLAIGAGAAIFGGMDLTYYINTKKFDLRGNGISAIFGLLVFKANTSSAELNPLTQEMASSMKISPSEMASYNSELSIIAGLFQSAGAAASTTDDKNLGLNQAAKYLKTNSQLLSPDTLSALSKVYRYSK